MADWSPDLKDRRKPDGSLIAVIDNNAGRRKALVAMLKPYYRVIDHEDGDQAMGSLMRDRPVAALVAERLPPLGGYEVVKRLRHTAGLEQLPVVLVVGSAGKMAQDGLRWCGANRLLVWPCHPSTALMVVMTWRTNCCTVSSRCWRAMRISARFGSVPKFFNSGWVRVSASTDGAATSPPVYGRNGGAV